MNVPFARRVQLSIMDRALPFDMGIWSNCIAGHCLRVQRALGEPLLSPPFNSTAISAYCATLLGLTPPEAEDLFMFNPDATREEAVALLDEYIAAAEQPSLRGKLRSRSARATLSQGLAYQHWHGLTPVYAIDLSEIKAILNEANEAAERLELVEA